MQLARDIGIDDESIRRWMRPDSTFGASHGALDEVLALARRRAALATEAADRLDAWLVAHR